MKARIQKWGNSLALRIPKTFAIEAGLQEHSPVELSLSDGKVVVNPVECESLTLDELLRKINRDNLHGEWDTGPAVGRDAL
jgi:antitoxin MazE